MSQFYLEFASSSSRQRATKSAILIGGMMLLLALWQRSTLLHEYELNQKELGRLSQQAHTFDLDMQSQRKLLFHASFHDMVSSFKLPWGRLFDALHAFPIDRIRVESFSSEGTLGEYTVTGTAVDFPALREYADSLEKRDEVERVEIVSMSAEEPPKKYFGFRLSLTGRQVQ